MPSTPPDLLLLAARVIWGLSWLFALVCGAVVIASIGLTVYSLYQRDVQLAQNGALLLGAATLGVLLAIAGIRVAGVS